MTKLISFALAVTLAASGANAQKKDDAQAKAAKKVVNAAASLLVELTKEDERAGKKKPTRPAKKPAGKPAAEKESPKGAAAKKAAAKKTATAKASANAENGAEIEADPVDIESDPVDQATMDEQVALERRMIAMEEALAIYSTRCMTCHGTKGRGDGPAAGGLNPRPRDYTNKAWLKLFADDALGKAIVEGGPAIGESPLMPPNPDLAAKPEVVKALVSMIRGF
jgi:mono/diheme cytochrome c family protein